MALSTLKAYLKKYPHFVVNQPLVAAEIESALRWMSYLAAASKYNTSHILSEFLYSSANLIQLLNDHLLRKAASLQINASNVVAHLQTLLQVLEYTSVLTEYTTNRFASDFGKWIIIGCFQIAKAVIKLILLLKFNQGLQTSSPIIPLDRRLDLICLQRNHNRTPNNSEHLRKNSAEEEDSPGPSSSGNPSSSDNSTVTLKRSGRVMRTIDKAPLRNQRTWMLPNSDPRFQQLLDRNRKDAPPSPLTEHQVWAEILHITRPVAHMATIGIFGPASWPPYLISLGMDLTSLKLLHEPHDKIWNMKESIELGQRSFALLLYFLRSPFYDRYTKERILRLLSAMANTIPIFGRLIRPMVSYLPEWQKTYFYVWGS